MPTSSALRGPAATLLALLALMTPIAGAQHGASSPLRPQPRSIYFSQNAKEQVPELFVAGGVVTTLRFPMDCDPRRTSLLGWEGRFEPLLAGGRSVVIVPLQNLAPGDRFLLRVTLMDGTELPFTLTTHEDRVDGQVHIFPVPTAPEAVHQALEEKRQENQLLLEENQRHRQEEGSVDHALATLLANHQLAMTPFVEKEKWRLHEPGVSAEISILIPRKGATHDRIAVVFQLTNQDPSKPWKLQEARLGTLSSWEPRPFALRMLPASIPPGKQGRIAIVTSMRSFETQKGLDRLVLELFKEGGRRQGYVLLEPR